MLDYLIKFNSLPQYLKDKMSDPQILAAIKELEEKYDISLAAVIMKVMVKDISILDLAKYFVFEFKLDGKKAEELVEELKERVLFVSADYLGFEVKGKKDLMGVGGKNESTVNKVKTSNFFFSSEDEEEVSQLTQNLGPKDKVKEVNDERINSLVDEVIFDTGVSFSSEELSQRFVKVLKTYARGVRNRIDTKLTLTKEVGNGGLGMSNGRVDEVLKSLDSKNKKNEAGSSELSLKEEKLDTDNNKELPKKPNIENFRKKTGNLISENVRDLEYDLSKMPKKAEGINDKNLLEKKIDAKGLSINPIAGIKINNESLRTPLEATPKIEDKKLEDHIAGTEGRFKSRTAQADPAKKRIEDVKVVPRLTGPIEELREMTIVDFRRLDVDPMRAVAKIKEKIDLLEDDGFRKKLEGISAWRESPISREYIDIGRKSIGQKKPINEIIHDKQISGQETLKEGEFVAIINLNKELRF